MNPGDLVGKCMGEPEVWGPYAACLTPGQLDRLAIYLEAMRDWQRDAEAMCGVVVP